MRGQLIKIFLGVIVLSSFFFSNIFNIVLAQTSSEPPYFYLETNFIDLGAGKNTGKYKIFAHPSVKWQANSPALDQKILALSSISGQGPAEIVFQLTKANSKLVGMIFK